MPASSAVAMRTRGRRAFCFVAVGSQWVVYGGPRGAPGVRLFGVRNRHRTVDPSTTASRPHAAVGRAAPPFKPTTIDRSGDTRRASNGHQVIKLPRAKIGL